MGTMGEGRSMTDVRMLESFLRSDGLMEEREYQTYLSLFNNMSNFMRKPNVIVYLDVTPEESYERIKKRSRECESALPLEYLQKLSRAYEDFLEDISQIIPVLRVNWSTFHTAEEMAEQIRVQYASMRSIKNVDWDAQKVPAPLTTPPPPLAKARYPAAEAGDDAVDVADAERAAGIAQQLGAATLESGPTSPLAGGETPN